MADSGSASSGSGRGGVCLAEHSPQFAATREPFRTTPSSSSDSTVRNARSPSDVFAADLSNQNSQLNYKNYQLPQPPKFQPTNLTSTKSQDQGSNQRSNRTVSQNPPHFSTGKASFPSERTAFATPTGRSAVQPNAFGHRSGPLPSATSVRDFGITPNAKTPGHHTPGSLNNDTRRIQQHPAPVEDKTKLKPSSELTKTNKIIAKMATHCQIDGPLAGPLRESRRSELARDHVSSHRASIGRFHFSQASHLPISVTTFHLHFLLFRLPSVALYQITDFEMKACLDSRSASSSRNYDDPAGDPPHSWYSGQHCQ